MERIALDTTFLIDLQSARRGRSRAVGAIRFLEARSDAELLLPVVALGEYLEGFEDPSSPEARALVDPLRVLETTPEVARVYAATTRHLRAPGRLIGANDLWIGCTARAAGVPIVTRDREHFERIPGPRVIDHTA
jgi:predicted nucleic acid-binding protein